MAPPKSDQHRVNDRIRAREVRLIGPDGSQLGIKPVPEALRMARGLDLDLVEVAPMANPPVCRIMDYGKFRYEEAQKAKEARRKSIHVTVKEVKFRPKIGRGDFDTKMRHLKEFLEDGHKVKVTLQFRGREVAHPELGRKILDDVIEAVGAAAKVENQARMEGRSMSLVLAPDKKAQDALRKAAEAERRMAATDPQTNPDSEATETNEDHEPIGEPSADPAGASVTSEPATPQTSGE
ncbi:MAG TPA: translation initiation factor IF-3 [Ilumatobacter sp.]